MKDCPFCGLAGREGQWLLFEGERAIVFLSNPRLMAGHTLVVPKRHVEKPWELAWEERREIFELLDRFEQKILSSLAPGCDVRQNYRPFIPQGRIKVDHVHYHLLPRWPEDELYQKSMKFEVELWTDLIASEQNEMLDRLK